MPPAARVFDPTLHGGFIVTGEPSVLIGYKPAARLGDHHLCPMAAPPPPHVGGVITTASESVVIGNAKAARLGDMCDCQSVGQAGVAIPPQVGHLETEAGPGSLGVDYYLAKPKEVPGDATLAPIKVHLDGSGAQGDAAVAQWELPTTTNPWLNEIVATIASIGTLGTNSDPGAKRKTNVTIDSLHAGGSAHLLLGSDGTRYGIGGTGMVGADAAGATFNDDQTTSLGLGFTLEKKKSFGISYGPSAGGGIILDYDTSDHRLHIGYSLNLGPFSINVDYGIGREGPPPAPAIPNMIVGGEPTVLIG
jgi:uncharacterized Zn-binding protein involved in type VI secretion